MSKFTEFDFRLRAFIKDPAHFLNGIAFVDAFHTMTVLAPKKAYAITIDGQSVTPVFSTAASLEAFKKATKKARKIAFEERIAFDVLEEEIAQGYQGLAFNPNQEDAESSLVFANAELLPFINQMTGIVNTLMTEENTDADIMDKMYLVPVYVIPKSEDRFERFFPTMMTPEGKSYVPAFSSLDSFAKWYNNDDFGGSFRANQGVVVTWRINDIYRPRNGEDDLEETFGVAINPFDEQQILVDWSDIDSE
ncbi:SseB family protein [Streptococcus sp. zg-JUN1979]|uniref:SseB family protein n=1 Tax=Streptococcus sp. zg-JUN1979 TaxID=3391450 RepID=UPI0039B09E80